MDKILKNCRMMTENRIEQKDLYIHNGFITDVRCSEEETESMPSVVIVPSLCNLHAHLGESIFSDISGNNWTLSRYLNYTDSYNKKLLPAERQIIWDNSAQFTIGELRHRGTSVFCAARAATPCKNKDICNLSGWPIMNSEKLIEYKASGLDGFKSYLKEYSSAKCSVGIFLHSLYANDETSLRLAVDCMEAGAEFLTVHIAEDEITATSELEKYGMSAVKTLDSYGLLTPNTILVHGGWSTLDDWELVATRGAIIAICPCSNIFLNTKMPDVMMLNKLHIPWCIATDGLATGRTLSLFEQASVLHNQFPSLRWRELFDAITSIPAQWYKRSIYTGRIEPGTLSEFIAIETMDQDIEKILSGLICGLYRWEYVKY